MSRTRSIGLVVGVAIVAIAAGMLLSRALLKSGSGEQQPALATGTYLGSARPLPAIAFVDQDGKPFGAERLRGRWSLLFFGFTSCPDVCPTTLAMLAQVEKMLADLPPQQRPQVVLVSVDPQRDTPAQLATYVKFFSPSFTGITAPPDATEEFTRQIGVPVAISRLDGGGYTVDHSASIFLINPEGALQALFSPPHTAKLIAADYKRVAATAGA